MVDETSRDYCKNSSCQFNNCCSFSSPSAPDERPVCQSPSHPQRCESVQFIMHMERFGVIGKLWISGTLEDSICRALNDVETLLQELSGLMVYFDSPGGSFMGGIYVERLILAAKGRMPVLAYVKSAMSAALIPALAAHWTCGDHMAVLGAFGMAFPACDGQRPFMIINKQSPEKFGPKPPRLLPRVFIESSKHRERLQGLANRQYNLDLSLLVMYSGVSVEQLRPYLDGRAMIAREALAAGLLDKVCTQNEAYDFLVREIRNRKPKGRKNGKK